MTGSAVELFLAYADALARGESPRAHDYLARAGESERERLAELLDRFVASTPVRPAAVDELGLVEAWTTGESPLVALRVRQGLKRDAVIAFLQETFLLREAARPALADRYHELEAGLIDPARLSGRLVSALSGFLGVREDTIRTLRPQTIEAAPAFRTSVAVLGQVPEFAAERDIEVDSLFLSND